MSNEPLGEAVEAIAEILCAWFYRDDSGKAWPKLSDVGQDSFRTPAAQLLDGTMPGREQSAAALIRSQVLKGLTEEFEQAVKNASSSGYTMGWRSAAAHCRILANLKDPE